MIKKMAGKIHNVKKQKEISGWPKRATYKIKKLENNLKIGMTRNWKKKFKKTVKMF